MAQYPLERGFVAIADEAIVSQKTGGVVLLFELAEEVRHFTRMLVLSGATRLRAVIPIVSECASA